MSAATVVSADGRTTIKIVPTDGIAIFVNEDARMNLLGTVTWEVHAGKDMIATGNAHSVTAAIAAGHEAAHEWNDLDMGERPVRLRTCGHETDDGNRDDPSYAYCGKPHAHAGEHGDWQV